MTPDSQTQQPSSQVVRQAIKWSLRLQDESADPRLYEQCERWRAQDAEHECAWQRIQTLNGELNRRFQALPVPGAALQALDHGTRRLDRRQALKLLSGVAVLGSATWLARDLTPFRQWSADYATRVGERGSFRLPDGTRLQLNTDSAVDQNFNGGQRSILLTRGEILVNAEGGQQRTSPLRVQDRHGLFETVNGRFVVRQYEQRTRVSVSAGELLIRLPGAGAVAVRSGQEYWVTPRQASPIQSPDMDAAAWVDGLIVTRNMRLRDFLAEVARYRRGHLGCTDDIADLRLSGVFRLDDTDKLLTVLPRTLPVELGTRTPWWVTLRRRA